MKRLLLIPLLLLGCNKPPETTTTLNKNFKVDTLFTYEGCTVYRFWDGGSRYYVNCNESSSTNWTVNTGKSTYNNLITTNQK